MWRTWRPRLLIILLLALAGAAAVAAFPYVASAYHLEAGGRAAEGVTGITDDAPSAIEHLERALEWLPENAQAYRLLAQVHRAQGDWLAAVEALTHYTELRPDNLLGHIELAEVYEEIEKAMAALDRIDLLPLLPQAAVKAPETPVDTPYGQPDGPAWQYYVAETTFSLPPGYGDRPTLFMHAPSRITCTLSLPEQPMVLRFDMGMDPQTHNWPGDGVTFEVFVDGERVFLEHVDKAMARKGWHRRTVDLSDWAGTEVALSLAATPGPVADPSGDWAGWGEPRVIDAQWPVLEALEPGGRMHQAWEKAGMTAESFILWGEAARREGRFEEAMHWYEQAMAWEPGLGDPWYYVGLLRENQGQWLGAVDAYERAANETDLRAVGRSSPLYRVGTVYQRSVEPSQPEKAQESYEKALATDDFASVSEEAWTHARLGQVYYTLGKRAVRAEDEILEALDLQPNDKWIHVVLGDLYRAEGRLTEAIEAYERSLTLARGFEAAQKRLELLDD